MPKSKVDRINELQLKAMPIRDQLEAMAKEFVSLHDEQWGTDEGDELMVVILDGMPYDDAMKRVMNIKKHRSL